MWAILLGLLGLGGAAGGTAWYLSHHKALIAASGGMRGKLTKGTVVKAGGSGYVIDGAATDKDGIVHYAASELQMQNGTVLPAKTGKTTTLTPLDITEIVSSPSGLPTGPTGEPTGAATMAPTTGKTYALNVFTAGGLSSQDLWNLLNGSNTPFAGAGSPPPSGKDGKLLMPAKVKEAVTGTGYTFAPTIDQWIAYTSMSAPASLPKLFGAGGTDVKGVVASAIELAPAALASTAAVSGHAGGHGRGRGRRAAATAR